MFKIGDRVKNKFNGQYGTIVEGSSYGNTVVMYDGMYDGEILPSPYWSSRSPHDYIELVDAPLEVTVEEALAMLEPKPDAVTRPQHYNQGKIEVIEFIEDKKLNYHKGNAIKHISRAGIKNKDKEIEDLRKAIWYLQREIEQLIAKNENREAVKPNDMRK